MATREQISKAIELAGDAGDMDAVRELGAMLKTAAPATPSTWDTVKHGLGNFARDALEFGSKTLGIVGDPANVLVNAAAGSHLGPVSETGGQLADAMGLPKPENNTERLVSAVNQGALGALVPVVGATGAVARGGGAVAKALAAAPVLQTVSGGTAGLGAELSRQSGGSPLAQLGWSLLAGIAPFGAAGLGGAVMRSRLVPGYVDRTAGAELAANTSDPAAAIQSIQTRQPTASGANPTLAEVTLDTKHAAYQRALGSTSIEGASARGDQMAANALARQGAIDTAFGPGDTADVSNYAARQAAALEAATGADIAKVGALEPYDVSGEAARTQLEAARDASSARVSHAYNHPDIVDAKSQPVRLAPPDLTDNLPQPDTGSQRAAFEQAARAGLKAGDSSNASTGGLASFIVSRGGINPHALEQGFKKVQPGVADLYSAGITPKARPGLFSTNGGSLDNLLTAAQEAGFFPPSDPMHPEKLSINDLTSALIDDVQGRPVYPAGDMMRGADRAAANSERDYWGNVFQRGDANPETMKPDDWDRLYRDEAGLPPHVVTQADVEGLADAASVGRPIGPMQSALLALKHDFYPDGVMPADAKAVISDLVSTEQDTVGAIQAKADRFRQIGSRADINDRKLKAFTTAAANSVDAFLLHNAGPEYRDALKAAQAASRAHHDVFSNGRIGEALKPQRANYNRDATEGGNVTAKLVPASDRTGAPDTRQLKTALGDQGAEQVAREELRRALEKATADGGDVSGKVAKVAKDYAGVLSEHPALAADIAAARDTAATHAAFLKSPLGALRDGNVEVATKVATALRAGGSSQIKSMIRATAGDAAARAGLRRAIAQYVVPFDQSAVVSNGLADIPRNQAMRVRLNDALESTAGTDLLDTRQRVVMRQLKDELDRQQFALSGGRVAGSDTALNQGVAGKLAARIAKRALVNATGSHWIVDTFGLIGDLTARRGAVLEALNRAMSDPDYAAKLLSVNSPAKGAAVAQELRQASARGAAAGAAATVDRVVGTPANFNGMASAAATDQKAKDK